MRRRAERRFERAREPLGAGNMNNTKWRAVLELIRGRWVAIKFVGEHQPRRVVGLSCINDCWCDCSAGPFLYTEIEWLEITGNGAPELLAELRRLGHLPLIAQSNGFRLQAYGMVADAVE